MSDHTKAFKRLLKNVKLSAKYGSKGGSFKRKFSNCYEKPVDITVEDLIDLYDRQAARCYWLGILLDPNDIFIKYHPLAMSVDRLDNSRAYILDNIVICSRFANLGKGAYSSEEFRTLLPQIQHQITYPFKVKTYTSGEWWEPI